jgi:hypothetical protein
MLCCHYSESCLLSVVILYVIMLSIAVLNVVMLSVVILDVILLSVVIHLRDKRVTRYKR